MRRAWLSHSDNLFFAGIAKRMKERFTLLLEKYNPYHHVIRSTHLERSARCASKPPILLVTVQNTSIVFVKATLPERFLRVRFVAGVRLLSHSVCGKEQALSPQVSFRNDCGQNPSLDVARIRQCRCPSHISHSLGHVISDT